MSFESCTNGPRSRHEQEEAFWNDCERLPIQPLSLLRDLQLLAFFL